MWRRLRTSWPLPRSVRPASQLTSSLSAEFLFAEYALIREARESALGLVEGRIKFVLALQSAQIAAIAVLYSRSVGVHALAILGLAIGLPTVFLSYVVYLRALDFQIQGRKYLRALNAIRKYFVEADPSIAAAILMSTDPKMPSMKKVGEGSSVLVSFAVTTLVLTLFWFLLLVTDMAWLIVVATTNLTGSVEFLLAVAIGVVASALVTTSEVVHIRRRLNNAEAASHRA
jgi:hypothetical protein